MTSLEVITKKEKVKRGLFNGQAKTLHKNDQYVYKNFFKLSLRAIKNARKHRQTNKFNLSRRNLAEAKDTDDKN